MPLMMTSSNAPLPAALSPADAAALQAALMPLLQGQIRRFTQGDSDSVPIETAEELLASIHYTVRFALRAQHLPASELARQPLTALFAQGQRALLACLSQTQAVYQEACAQVQAFGSRSLRDTLRGLGGFFAAYDARLFAHLTPGDIDYQLAHPVPDAQTGVLFVRDYLSRLLTENELLTRMDGRRVVRLLLRACPDYPLLLVNLYEPIAANVVGLSLLGGGETLLELTLAQAQEVRTRLMALTPAQARVQLARAALDACRRLGLQSPLAPRYLTRSALAIYPRLAASPQSVWGVFSPCEAPCNPCKPS